MALNPLTLSTTQGVQGRPFRAKINGLTTGKVEVLNDGAPGFSTVNGFVLSSSIPYQVSTVVLREYEPGVGAGFRDTRIDISALTRDEVRTRALASIGAGRTLKRVRVAGDRQPDGAIAYAVYAEDDLGATIKTDLGGPVGPVVIPRPAEFNLDPAMWPFTFTRQTDGSVTSDFDPLVWAPAPRLGDAGVAVFYADASRPTDSGDGLTPATAKRQIMSAVTLGNNQANPFVVICAPGTYPRAQSPSGASGTTAPNKPCTLMIDGAGWVITGMFDALTWALDQGTTYVASRSLVRRVIDISVLGPDGYHPDIPYVASQALCRSTPNSWFTDNVSVWINRGDGAPVTNANTQAMLNVSGSAAALQMSTGGNMHVLGNFELRGGMPVRLTGSPTNRFYGEGFRARYSSGNDGVVTGGTTESLSDGSTVLGVAGAVFRNCDASANQKDGFNAHIQSGTLPFMVTINCTGINNGRGPAGRSCNGVTTHDGCKAIDLRGSYRDNAGGQVAIVNDGTQMWCIDTQCDASRGDIIFGGSVPPADYLVDQGTPTLFLDNCRSINTQYSRYARFGRILNRGGSFAGQTFTANGGVVAEFA